MSHQAMRERAARVVRRLRDAGHVAYFAGGCVRDMVMNILPKDYDVATSATPQDVAGLFDRTIATGAQFGVMIVVTDGQNVEVATFRSDEEYADGRHPIRVEFSGEKEDAERRDFTINGMFYDPIEERFIDYVGGREDIRRGIIRTIGDPYQRFKEDRLRLIRAVRFSARYGYAIEEETRRALVALAGGITLVSAERVREELVRILTEGPARRGVELLHDTTLLAQILPEVAALEGVEQPAEFHPEGDVLTHTLVMLEHMRSPSPELAMAVLLHDVGKPHTLTRADRIRFHGHAPVGAQIAEEVCRRLRFSNKQTAQIVDLVGEHLKFMHVQEMRENKRKRLFRKENFAEHLELHRLDCLASHGNLDNWEYCLRKLEEYRSEEIHPPRLLGGDDLIAMGYRPGPRFREILTAVEDAQLDGTISTSDEARELVKTRFPLESES